MDQIHQKMGVGKSAAPEQPLCILGLCVSIGGEVTIVLESLWSCFFH